MLASITPLGERGRRSSWGVTVVAFLLGSTAAALAAGAAAGGLGELAVPGGLSGAARFGALAGAGLAATLIDALRDPVPGPRRQVDERWLDRYRGWVYGLGFGAQLGLGVTTVVSSAALYVALLAALLSADPAAGAAIIGAFGLARGLTPLAAARVRRPEQLLALHAGLLRWRERTRRLVLVATAAIAALAVLAGVS
jgi:hypothetical protein